MRSSVFFALLLAACSTDHALAASTAPESADVCLTDGSFDFHVWSNRVSGYDGFSIVATAVEPQNTLEDPKTTAVRVPVRLGTEILDGSFSIACPSSLRADDWYPSYALYIDANRDGRCDDGDLGIDGQRYAWNTAIDEDVGIDVAPVNGLSAAVGSTAATFCDAYFP